MSCTQAGPQAGSRIRSARRPPRGASVERIERVARRALARGVAIQTLSRFAASERARAGIVLGYGGIHTSNIERGLRILRKCFAASADD